MYLCAKGVTHVEGWRNCSAWNNLGACGTVEKKLRMFHVERSFTGTVCRAIEMFHVEHPLAASFVVESARLSM